MSELKKGDRVTLSEKGILALGSPQNWIGRMGTIARNGKPGCSGRAAGFAEGEREKHDTQLDRGRMTFPGSSEKSEPAPPALTQRQSGGEGDAATSAEKALSAATVKSLGTEKPIGDPSCPDPVEHFSFPSPDDAARAIAEEMVGVDVVEITPEMVGGIKGVMAFLHVHNWKGPAMEFLGRLVSASAIAPAARRPTREEFEVAMKEVFSAESRGAGGDDFYKIWLAALDAAYGKAEARQ